MNRNNKFCPPCKSRDHCYLECPSRERCSFCNKAGHEQSNCFRYKGMNGNSNQFVSNQYDAKKVRFMMLKSTNTNFSEKFQNFSDSISDDDSSEDEYLVESQNYEYKTRNKHVSTKAIQTTLSRPNNLIRHTSVLYRDGDNIFSVDCKVGDVNLKLMIDTGSDISVISLSSLMDIRKNVNLNIDMPDLT